MKFSFKGWWIENSVRLGPLSYNPSSMARTDRVLSEVTKGFGLYYLPNDGFNTTLFTTNLNNGTVFKQRTARHKYFI